MGLAHARSPTQSTRPRLGPVIYLCSQSVPEADERVSRGVGAWKWQQRRLDRGWHQLPGGAGGAGAPAGPTHRGPSLRVCLCQSQSRTYRGRSSQMTRSAGPARGQTKRLSCSQAVRERTSRALPRSPRTLLHHPSSPLASLYDVCSRPCGRSLRVATASMAARSALGLWAALLVACLAWGPALVAEARPGPELSAAVAWGGASSGPLWPPPSLAPLR